ENSPWRRRLGAIGRSPMGPGHNSCVSQGVMIERGKLTQLTPEAPSLLGASHIAGLRLLLAVPEGTDVAPIRRALRAEECRARTEIVNRLSDAEARVATM